MSAEKRIRELEEILVASPDDYLVVDGKYAEASKMKIKHVIGTVTAGVATFNDRVGDVVPEAGDYTPDMVGIDGAASTITVEDLTPEQAVCSNADGKIAVAETTLDELNALHGIEGSVQEQLDNIPNLHPLNGVTVALNDEIREDQQEIYEQTVAVLTELFEEPSKWNAVIVTQKYQPSGDRIDALYVYDGEQWVFWFNTCSGIDTMHEIVVYY